MQDLTTTRHRLRIAAIVLVIIGPIAAIVGMVHANVARLSQTGDLDLTVGISGVTVLFVGLELLAVRSYLRRAAELNGIARSNYTIQMIVLVVFVGSIVAAIAAGLVGAIITISIGMRECQLGC